MSEVIKAYPLQWPAGWRRTESHRRVRAKFSKGERQYSANPGGGSWVQQRDITINDAVTRVRAELGRMNVRDDDIVISSNLVLRLDGLPKSGQSQPADPGAAVYWRTKGERRCMAVDQYDRVEHNLAAIAATLDAMRAIKRHGGAEILDRAFTGFAALPAPMTGQKPWRDVLGVQSNESGQRVIEEAYRRKRGETHPDREGGDHDAFLSVQAAYEAAGRELGFTP